LVLMDNLHFKGGGRGGDDGSYLVVAKRGIGEGWGQAVIVPSS